MKVLQLAGDVGGGCSHYRMHEPARVAAAEGIEIETTTGLDVDGYTVEDRVVIEDIKVDADVVVFQRPVLSSFVEAIKILQKRGVACVVELDDDIAGIHKNNIAYASHDPIQSPIANWKWLMDACEIADLVITSTPALADKYARHGRAAVLRNCVPRYELTRPKEYNELTRLGWTGTVQTHPEDLDVVGVHVRSSLMSTGRDKFYVVGDGALVPEKLLLREDVTVVPTGWVERVQYMPKLNQTIDIGIVPLNLDPFNQAKSFLKGLEMASQGIPAVLSPTAENTLLSELTGFPLAKKTRDWSRHLSKLLNDRDYAIEVGQTGKSAISHLTYENSVGYWIMAWQQAMDNRARADRGKSFFITEK